jgi:KUP system potassium uptake protein
MVVSAPLDLPAKPRRSLAPLALGALGVVYGDIGTSPLYTLKTALEWGGGATPDVALGMLSLIVWTLLITTSLKYVLVVMRFDNQGEGGILALMSLLWNRRGPRTGLIAVGLAGAALLYSDGAITPAISVLSALEGLKLPMPEIAPYVLPATVAVLIGLFALQPQGTARIGRLFGPVMTVWFIAIGLLGAGGVAAHPHVLLALDPRVGLGYVASHGVTGFLVLGAVFLSATGAEALYADMGHFGAAPIRMSWYGLVLPTLVLNYAGQTAEVVGGAVPAGANPFFMLCPAALQIPLVGLSTAATIIASQSIISGAFSMTRQAIQLGFLPRLPIIQTSAEGYGQIYIGPVNWLLMAVTVSLAVGFGSSDNLAAAFGIAVSLTMLLTSVLVFAAMRELWGWGLLSSTLVAGGFAAVDLSFVSANLMKVLEGGWAPLALGTLLFFVMTTWRKGRLALLAQLERDTVPLAAFIARSHDMLRVPGTGIYMTGRLDVVPVPLLHNMKHNKVLHDRIVLLNVATEHVPRVVPEHRLMIADLGNHCFAVSARYGFMEQPDIPRLLADCATCGLAFDLMDTSFFIGQETIMAARPSCLNRAERMVFQLLKRSAVLATDFFQIPLNRVVELGAQVAI